MSAAILIQRVSCNTVICQLQYSIMSAAIYYYVSCNTCGPRWYNFSQGGKVLCEKWAQQCYQYPAVCQSNDIAHKWDKQYQQKQGDIPNIQNITGKSIETHLNNYSSYDKHASLQAAVSMNFLPDYQHKQRLSMACMRMHSGYVKHALVHHYKQLVSMNGLPDYQYRLRSSMANMYIVCIHPGCQSHLSYYPNGNTVGCLSTTLWTFLTMEAYLPSELVPQQCFKEPTMP